jgi:hypothetical protein
MRTTENTSCDTDSIVACVYCGLCLEIGLHVTVRSYFASLTLIHLHSQFMARVANVSLTEPLHHTVCVWPSLTSLQLARNAANSSTPMAAGTRGVSYVGVLEKANFNHWTG